MARHDPRTARVVLATTALVALAACSKTRTSDSTPATSASSSSSSSDAAPADAALPDGGLAVTPPSAADWDEISVSRASLKVRIPSGATVPADHAGRDKKFAGSYFRVVMPSGYDVLFAERHGADHADLLADKQAFHAKTKGKGIVLYDADDAFVVSRDEGADAGGRYCETTACGKVGGRVICALAAGARLEGTVFTKLTDTECLAIVSIARSIEEL